jgi:excisionase family DNA binding protein
MENKLITPRELYEYLNKDREVIGRQKVYQLVKRKDFPALKIGGKFYIIEQKVDEWLNKQSEKFWC